MIISVKNDVSIDVLKSIQRASLNNPAQDEMLMLFSLYRYYGIDKNCVGRHVTFVYGNTGSPLLVTPKNLKVFANFDLNNKHIL
jgi:hypothetical protein